MKLACATLSADGFKTISYEKSFSMLPKAGYSFIEFNLWDPRVLAPSKMTELKYRCAETGLIPAVVHGSGIACEGNTGLEVGYLTRLMHMAHELGCTRVCVSGGKRTEKALDNAIGTLKVAVQIAEELGIEISLENHAGNTFEFIEDYRKICSAVTSSKVGICLDTGHFDASGVSMDALIDELGSRIIHVHLKENKGMGTANFTRFGEGTTDIAHVLERLADIGYNGFMTVELSPQKDRESTIEDLRIPIEMFSQFEKIETVSEQELSK